MLSILDFSITGVSLPELWQLIDDDLGNIADKVARYLVEKTPTPLDNMALPYIREAIKEALKSQPEPAPMMATAFASALPIQPEAKEDAIRRRAAELGVGMNPILIGILLRLAWPIIEKLLDKWSKK